MSYILAAPCHFGLEAVLKREITALGLEIHMVEDGRVYFLGEAEDIARANIFLRSAERILLECGRFTAETYDELFENVKAIPWEDYIPKNGKFWVAKAYSVKSKLFSPSDIQSIAKKAMVDRLGGKYGITWFDEDGDSYPLRISIMKDVVSVCLDTTGISLHKRGYRTNSVMAPISETLAAAIILMTPWKRGRIFADPCCGSGTFPIEAAMIACNIPPGMNRDFLSENWDFIGKDRYFRNAVAEGQSAVDINRDSDIQGYDIDANAIESAAANAKAAGVRDVIHFQRRDLRDFSHSKKYGFIVTNPPYGERISAPSAGSASGRPDNGRINEEKDSLFALYRTLGEVYSGLDSWSMYVVSSYDKTQDAIGRRADKNRKIYNGMIEARIYQYLGPKPPKRKDKREE